MTSKFKNKVDVCIFLSNEKHKEKGIRLLSAFWQRGIKVITDFRNKRDIFDFCTINSVRFLIMFIDEKEDGYVKLPGEVVSQIKIKDFKNKTEDTMDIDRVFDYFEEKYLTREND